VPAAACLLLRLEESSEISEKFAFVTRLNREGLWASQLLELARGSPCSSGSPKKTHSPHA
jgi:hypothetical protein